MTQAVEAPEASPGDASLELKREFTLWSAGAFAFAFISPIVALYGIFGLAFSAAGPSLWWGFWIVLAFQLLVALVFAELASKWPFEGSIYQWTRRIMGQTWGWFAGWAYIWTLVIACGTVAYITAGFIPVVLDTKPFSQTGQILTGIGILAFVTVVNTVGRKAMKVLVALSITAELLGSIVIGTILLFFHNEHGPGVLFESHGASYGGGPLLWAGLAASMAFIGWSFVGFESAGAIGEEVKNPARDVPKAVIWSIVIVAAVVIYSSLGLILAIPDFDAVLSGKVADPVADTISAQLGSGITRPLFALFIVGFVASALALQASASRLMWAFARDDVLPASGFLKKLSTNDRLPINAIVTAAALSILILLSTRSDNLFGTLVNFTTGGFYIAFAFPIFAALLMRLRKTPFEPGPFSLGRWGLPVAAVASAWIVFELINIAWPRADGVPWYQDWGVVVMIVVVGAIGWVVYATKRSKILDADTQLRGE
jgi:amino acid transporter